MIKATKEVIIELKDGCILGTKELCSPAIEKLESFKDYKIIGPVIVVVFEILKGMGEGAVDLFNEIVNSAFVQGTNEVVGEIFGCLKKNSQEIMSDIPKKMAEGFDSRGESTASM